MDLNKSLGMNGQGEISMEHKELVIKYYKKLINSLFKPLPIFEGKDNSGKITYDEETAFRNFQIYISNLLVEIHGNSQLFFCSDNSIKLASILKGMLSEIQIGEQPKVKRLIMQCINICKQIILEIEKEE